MARGDGRILCTATDAGSRARLLQPKVMITHRDADDLVPLLPKHEGAFKRNFIKQAVCEFKFPTLLAMGGAAPPKAFVSALRKAYPVLELNKEVPIGFAESTTANGHSHVLKSSKQTWTVTIKKDAVVIETSRYTDYKEMRSRTDEVIKAASGIIDSDFFTRVGMRYINAITTDGDSPLHEWINPSLVGPVEQQGFKGVADFAGRLRLETDDGGCLLQHGLKHKSGGQVGLPTLVPDYIIDIDCYRSEVPLAETLATLDNMRMQVYSMFQWAIGVKAKEYLGELQVK